jgi:hypothetical protein
MMFLIYILQVEYTMKKSHLTDSSDMQELFETCVVTQTLLKS